MTSVPSAYVAVLHRERSSESAMNRSMCANARGKSVRMCGGVWPKGDQMSWLACARAWVCGCECLCVCARACAL